jgi:hypothetical protein
LYGEGVNQVSTRRRTASPDFRIACCLCRKPIPRASDAYALDAEWQRRFPDMVGTLACTCAVSIYWRCRTAAGVFVAGHRLSTRVREANDQDAWHHIDGHGTHIGMVQAHPEAGAQQGAADYLRHVLQRPYVDPQAAQRIHAALTRWEA